MAPSSNPSLHLNSYKRSTDPKGAPTLRTQGIGGIFFASRPSREGPVSDTFVSYARPDQKWVKSLANILERHNVSIWFDEDIVPGEQFDSKIEAAIANARKVIVVWSGVSIGSQWVKAEAREGLDRGILVPVLKERVRIPLEFRRVQAADLSEWSGDVKHKEFQKLLAALSPRGGNIGQTPTDVAADRIHGRTVTEGRRIVAELVQANRYTFYAKIRLIVGREVFMIEHLNKITYQVVCVNGIEVGRGGSFSEGDNYFQFCVEHNRDQLFMELRPQVSIWIGLSKVELLVDEKEVLTTPISWAHGFPWVILVGAIVFSLIWIVSP